MKFLNKIRGNNKGSDTAIIGMAMLIVTLVAVSLTIDFFTQTMAKLYVVNAMQNAQSSALTKAIIPRDLEDGSLRISEPLAKSEYRTLIQQFLKANSGTVFSMIDYRLDDVYVQDTSLADKNFVYIWSVTTVVPKRYMFSSGNSKIAKMKPNSTGNLKNNYKITTTVSTSIVKFMK